MSLNTAGAHLLESAYGFVGVIGGNRSHEAMFCAHDGAMILHPPCYGCHGEHDENGKKDPSRRYGKNDVDMVDKCIEYFTGQNEQANWWKWEQKKIMERWNQSHQYLGITSGNGELDLRHFAQLFIDAFFSNPGTGLKDRVDVQWTDYTPNPPPPPPPPHIVTPTKPPPQTPPPAPTPSSKSPNPTPPSPSQPTPPSAS